MIKELKALISDGDTVYVELSKDAFASSAGYRYRCEVSTVSGEDIIAHGPTVEKAVKKAKEEAECPGR